MSAQIEELVMANEPGEPLSGGQILVQTLADEGVDTIFGYPGGAIMPTYDALVTHGNRLRHVLVRHEQGATHAAQGYARVSGQVGVCLATSGPGATNFITGLADALMDSTPLLCIAGQVPTAKLGTDAFQEADAFGLTLSATKWSYQITDPSEVADVVRRGLAVARTGRPGSVFIEITRDAQMALASESRSLRIPEWTYPSRSVDASGLDAAAELINQARRPLIMLGHGVSISRAEVVARAVADRTGAPVAVTLLGLGAIDSAHPQYVGLLGMHGNYAPNLLTNEADVILAVGMRFDDRVTGRVDRYARDARIVHIDIDPAEIGRQVSVEVALVGDARAMLADLLPRLTARSHARWRARFDVLARQERRCITDVELARTADSITMAEVVDRVSAMTGGDAIVVSDVGQHQMMAARYYRFGAQARHVTSGGLGTMGFALPAAIGCAVARHDRPVVAVIGDGGFQMTLQELGTLMQEQLPVKIIILNNQHLGMVRQWQELFFHGRLSEVEMTNPDFVTIARGYRITAERVEHRRELDVALSTLLNSPGPYLLEVCVGRCENVFPMIPTGAAVDEMRLE